MALRAQLEKYVRKVKRWVDGEMKLRWVAVSFLEIERKIRINNYYDKLELSMEALKHEQKLSK